MELRDLLVTPIFLIVTYGIAYKFRPYVTDDISKRYFFPALTLKIFGAISLGLIYTFYYDGGDTFKYHTYGSHRIWEIMFESPEDALKLFFLNGGSVYNKYVLNFPIIRDNPSFFVARISFLFDLFTFSTYSATAILFAVLSFTGMWLLFKTFYEDYSEHHRSIALAVLFIPSVIFWGSGILKDTITLSCLGIATYYIRKLFIQKSFSFTDSVILILSLYVIFSVKKYILFCFIPSALVWFFFSNLTLVKSAMVKIMLIPLIVIVTFFLGYYSVIKVGEGDEKYAVDKLAQTAKITAYDIRYQTGSDAGSGYELGELDGTMGNLMKLLPKAINVSLFRPYLWEVKNPLMLLSALESLALLGITIYVVFKAGRRLFNAVVQPDVLFCLIFSISFAFAVGVSTFNFGTLTRYKIPLMPFYLLALVLIRIYIKRDKKLEELDSTE
jgi:hypothetical protein